MQATRTALHTSLGVALCAALGAMGYFGFRTIFQRGAACDAPGCVQPQCSAQFRGNISDLVELDAGCGALSVAPDAGTQGAYLLAFHGSSARIRAFDITVALGPAPSAGVFSAQSATHWAASAVSAQNAGCELRAGSESVPAGSFTLTLTSLTLASAGAGVAHGSLNATMYVHARPNTDCGAGESEALSLTF